MISSKNQAIVDENFLTRKAVEHCNKPPRKDVDSLSVDFFKNRLDKHWAWMVSSGIFLLEQGHC